MKNIYLATALLGVFAFSACSDDKDDELSEGVCYISVTMPDPVGKLDMCEEGKTKPITAAECKEAAGELSEMGSGKATATIKASCPTGQQLKCEAYGLYFVYVYNKIFADMGTTCDDMGFEDAN